MSIFSAAFIKNILKEAFLKTIEAAAQRCSIEKVLLKMLQNLQENTCARASVLKCLVWLI